MNLKKTTQILFGGSGYSAPSLSDVSEHGRVGNIITGRAFKYVSLAPHAVRVAEDAGDSNIQYVGKAGLGSATGDAVWQIKRIDSTSGTVITFADSDDKYDNIWDNRESLTYG